MNATPLSVELAKLTSLTNRVVYRLVKASAMSLAIGFIAGWKAGFCLFMLIIAVEALEDSFSKCCIKYGFRISLISLLCVLLFSFFIGILWYIFIYSNKDIASFMAYLGLRTGSGFMDVFVTVKTPKDAL